MPGNTPAQPNKSAQKTNRANQITVSRAVTLSTQKKEIRRKLYREIQFKQRKLREAFRKAVRKRLSLNEVIKGTRCRPSTSVYGGASQGDKSWICSRLQQITYHEKNYDIRECEVRVFIEGAEVTPYIRGNISWSIQTTGGMNNCTFSLNNNHDAFVLTPANVCSKTDLHGWRVLLDSKRHLISAPGRPSRNVDEAAKYIIYKNKYERVRPGSPSQQIDEAGFWMYPLTPFSCILNKHDCVRVFYRLPHVTGVCKVYDSKGNCAKVSGQEYDEVWAPAFTGFVDEYDIDDNPVDGDRIVNVRCYDWRGLLNRMRVRMQPNQNASAAAQKARQNNPIFAEQQAKNKKEKGKGGTADFLKVTDDLGINTDLIALYNSWFVAKTEGSCSKKANRNDCAKQAQEEIRGSVANKVAEMRQIYLGGVTKDPATGNNVKTLGLKDALAALKKAEGITGTLKRKNDDTIEIEYDKKGFASAVDAISKATKFINSTGKTVRTLAEGYVAAYPKKFVVKGGRNTHYAKELIIDITDPKPQRDVCKLANQEDAIKSLDASMRSDYPKIYEEAINDIPDVSRVYLLNQYMLRSVRKFFTDQGEAVSPTILDKLDQDIKSETNRQGVAGGGRILFGSKSPVVVFTAPGTGEAVVAGLTSYVQESGSGNNAGGYSGTLIDQGKVSKARITGSLSRFNSLYRQVRQSLNAAIQAEMAALQSNPNVRTRGQADALRKRIEQVKQENKSPIKNSESNVNVADIVLTDARFDQVNAGMFADLVRASDKDAHPLAGFSFEMAVEWLTLTHTPISKGFEDKLKKYDRSKLQDWNMTALFGVIGRPLTYREVTAMGRGALAELDSTAAPFSPLHPFMHMLLPADGTGAGSIVQQDITHNGFAAKDYTYKTRLELLNQICETLDYQFYVSPAGDLMFEFPNYNALPYDFGRVFQGAYTVLRGLRNFKIASEQGELNTAWVITGKETEKKLDQASGSHTAENIFKKTVIVAPILARRVGVKVRYLNIELPGVGAAFAAAGVAEATRIAFGLLEIQRELGRMETASVSHDFRPYLLPNRPIHVVHRQRMALSKAVNYSMSPPDGDCTSSVDLHYVRGLHQDGSFRHMSGGTRMPVDYSGLFTGAVNQSLRFGAQPRGATTEVALSLGDVFKSAGEAAERIIQTGIESEALRDSILQNYGQRQARSFSNWSCSPYLRDRWIEASSSYSDQMDASFRKANVYTSWTQGADGVAGTLAPLPRGGAGYIASLRYRPSNAARSPQAAATLEGSGLKNASEAGTNKDNPQPTSGKDYYGNLYNPWPYGRRDKGSFSRFGKHYFNQWGFYRVLYRNGTVNWKNERKFHKGKLSGWHNGIDFVGELEGTPAYTPIDLVNAHAAMGTAYTGYSSGEYAWSSLYQPIMVPDAIRLFTIKGKNTERYGPGGTVQYLIDKKGYDLYQRIRREYKFSPLVGPHIQAKVGLMLTCWGYVSLPGSPNSKLACELRYIHCGGLLERDNKEVIGKLGVSKAKRSIPKGTAVIKIGSTGATNPHLHFEMSLFKPGSRTLIGTVSGDDDAYKEVAKANADFLRTQIKMRLTAGGVGNLNKNTLSDSWQRYFANLNERGAAQVTTIDQAVEYLLSREKRFRSLTNSNYGKIDTNPMFFFRPEEIVKKYADQYKKYRELNSENFFDASTGSNICGANSGKMQQMIALEYSTCLGKVRKFPDNRKRDGRNVCRAFRDKRQAALQPRKDTSDRTGQKIGGRTYKERVHRKLDAQTKANTEQSASSGQES